MTFITFINIFSEIICSKPTISQATLSPSDDSIAFDAAYTVTCNTGYKIAGGNKMKCGASGFDQTPSCNGEFLYKIQLPAMPKYAFCIQQLL